MNPLSEERIVAVEWAPLAGTRPRKAGSNARLGDHGATVNPAFARLTTASGVQGFGFSRIQPAQAAALLGCPLSQLFALDQGTLTRGLAADCPLWDLVGQLTGRPAYQLAAQAVGVALDGPLRVPCYDTSLYIDDLHLASDEEAAALIAAEAAEGWARGHRAFKIKIGRGARHMPLSAGLSRDIAVIQAVRAAVGQDAPIMVDVNNGYNLNMAKHLLQETAACRIHWIEEPFHEDDVLYRDLHAWLSEQGLATLVADGEGHASPALLDWAQAGLIDVVQYDIFGFGFTPWLALGRRLDAWDVASGPHHYGAYYGNYATCHLAAAIARFAYVEWDEAVVPAIDTSGYVINEGCVHVPDAPGFGLVLDEFHFQQAVDAEGYRLL